MEFTKKVFLPVSPEEAFLWHQRQGAIERLTPKSVGMRILKKEGSIFNGDSISIKFPAISFLPFPQITWSLRHQNFEFGKQFEDTQISGPFAAWTHTHSFKSMADGCELTDRIKFSLPLSPFGEIFAGYYTKSKLNQLFEVRHMILKNDLLKHKKFSEKKLKILVTGSSGMVGSELIAFLQTGGHTVIRCLRFSGHPNHDEISNSAILDEKKGEFLNPEILQNLDAVVHLAGANIGEKSWTAERKKVLKASRIDFTQTFIKALEQAKIIPKTFVSASGIGIYGNGPMDKVFTENSKSGDGFLAELAQEWEKAVSENSYIKENNIRTAFLRMAVILSSHGGALDKIKIPFQLGVGGKIGNGKQPFSWIAMDDVLGVILFTLANNNVTGPINVCAPKTVTNEEFSKTLSKVLHRPCLFPVPETMVKLIFGEMGENTVLSGQHAVPQRLQELGFTFQFAEIREALSFYLNQ